MTRGSPGEGFDAMTTTDCRRLQTEVRGLISNLRRAEDGGQPPVVPPAKIGDASAYLEWILVDVADGLRPHIAMLEEAYRVEFRPGLSRSYGGGRDFAAPAADERFRHRDMLDEARTGVLLDRGLAGLRDADAFPDGEAKALGRLLLNPNALWDLSDAVGMAVPDSWLARMDEVGMRLADEGRIDLGDAPKGGIPRP